MKVLAINCGSSSVKAELFDAADLQHNRQPAPLWQGLLLLPEADECTLSVNAPGRHPVQRTLAKLAFGSAMEYLLNPLWTGSCAVVTGPQDIKLVGHRVVHGGTQFHEPAVVNANVFHKLSTLVDLAPLHQQRCLDGITASTAILRDCIQIAVFDTGFHASLPPASYIYPIPYNYFEEHGIRRYGFHGINHSYASRRALTLAGKAVAGSRVISCHLGAGCSLAAIKDGRSIRTTMGFTPLEGLMMASRSGSIDPGVILYLAEHCHLNPEHLSKMLNHESGLLGVSGISSDLREIEDAAKQGDERAKLAITMFVDTTAAYIASMAPSMNGVDVLVFSGGIGENSASIRQLICAQLNFLGLRTAEMDVASPDNSQTHGDRLISTADSKVVACVVHAKEEQEIARQALIATPALLT